MDFEEIDDAATRQAKKTGTNGYGATYSKFTAVQLTTAVLLS